MLLYRLATEADEHGALAPPSAPGMRNRDSYASMSGESSYSLSGDSKYPTDSLRGLVPYTYDPEADSDLPEDDEDALHRLEKGAKDTDRGRWFTLRAFTNVGALVLLILCLLALFIAFPAVSYYHDRQRNEAIDNSTNVNSTGQVPSLYVDPPASQDDLYHGD
jgi:beta-glucan synthesis-associated protein KRE6